MITPIFKLTESCNYACEFCRYSKISSSSDMMSIQLVKDVIEQVVKKNSGYLEIIFHGGEPLLWGIERFEKVFRFEDELKEKYGISIKNSIQTNGALLDDSWVKLFKKNDVTVGISIDGPIELNCHYSQSENKKSEFDTVMNNIQLLKRNNINHGILSVITNKHIDYGARYFWDFLTENSIKKVGLLFCYNPELKVFVDAKRLGDYLIDLWDIYSKSLLDIYIREFDDAINCFWKNKDSYGCSHNCRNTCGDFITIYPNGKTYFCDDYSLGEKLYIGNVKMVSVTEVLQSDQRIKIREMVLQNAYKYCRECNVNWICGYGCPRTEINGKKNYFCPSYKKIYRDIYRTLEKI